MYIQLLLIIYVLNLFGNISTDVSNRSENLCDTLFNENNEQWKEFCKEWNMLSNHTQNSSIKAISQPRKGSFRSGSSLRTSSIIKPVNRLRYNTVYRSSIKTRPAGWFWSHSQKVFLRPSKTYYYRAHSSRQQTTTISSSDFNTYYYCTSNDSIPIEIQCTTTYGDKQCCDDEKTQQVVCCGAQLDDDLADTFNHTTKILSQIFYTLTILTLLMRQFYP